MNLEYVYTHRRKEWSVEEYVLPPEGEYASRSQGASMSGGGCGSQPGQDHLDF